MLLIMLTIGGVVAGTGTKTDKDRRNLFALAVKKHESNSSSPLTEKKTHTGILSHVVDGMIKLEKEDGSVLEFTLDMIGTARLAL